MSSWRRLSIAKPPTLTDLPWKLSAAMPWTGLNSVGWGDSSFPGLVWLLYRRGSGGYLSHFILAAEAWEPNY